MGKTRKIKLSENMTDYGNSYLWVKTSYQAVKEYLALLWGKYQVANRKRKGAILDEVVENLGLHRKGR